MTFSEIPFRVVEVDRRRNSSAASLPSKISAVAQPPFRTPVPSFYGEHYFGAAVLQNVPVETTSQRPCYEVRLSIKGSPVGYCTGDHVSLYPQNDAVDTGQFVGLMGWDGGALIRLEPQAEAAAAGGGGDDVDGSASSSLNVPFVEVLSVFDCLLNCADLSALLSQRSLAALAPLLGDERERAVVTRLAEDAAYYKREAVAVGLDLRDLPRRFPSFRACRFADVLPHVPQMKPRTYSIASAAARAPEEVHVCYRVVDFTLASGAVRRGVCTAWLQQLSGRSTIVPVAVERYEKLRLPASLDVPMVLIGAGTGVAPFKAFVEEQSVRMQRRTCSSPAAAVGVGVGNGTSAAAAAAADAASKGRSCVVAAQVEGAPSPSLSLRSVLSASIATADGGGGGRRVPRVDSWLSGGILLFLGFREESELMYQHVWEAALKQRVIRSYSVSYSHAEQQLAVAEDVRKEASSVWKAVRAGGYVFMCGGCDDLRVSVERAFLHILEDEGGLDERQAAAYLDTLRASGRYVEDTS